MTHAASTPEVDQRHGDRAKGPQETEAPSGLSRAENEEVEARGNPSTPVVFEILRREGEAEMDRPLVSLGWSGLTAGFSLAFSLVAEGALRSRLPDTPWRSLITHAGYPVGFLIVVLGRQQLFTENTITAVLPVTKGFTLRKLGLMGRLWAMVLVANLVGTLLAAVFTRFIPAFPPDVVQAMLAVAREEILPDPMQMFWCAVPAGFLVAGMVWLLPTADAAQFHVVALMTYLIAVAGLKHVIAGSFDAFLLMMNGALSPGAVATGFLGPVLLGNIIGGTGLFALLSYGQVAKEI
jgi:formate/nitrite transporter FocA (FNT family)